MKPLPSSVLLRLGFGIAILVVAQPVARAQSVTTERCRETSIATLSGDCVTMDVGTGATTVSQYGRAARELRMPDIGTGMTGLATLYHSVLQFDVSYTAFDGSGTSLCGTVPRPNLDAANLLQEEADAVQPRPGTWPGLYIYEVDGHFYQYGSAIESGASPSSTADYSSESDSNPYVNKLSGAQLFRYTSASPQYIEVKHVDGTIARFDWFNPYKSSYTPLGILWRLTEVRDPYDNVATYSYNSKHRLVEISFPSGLKQMFDYEPGWNFGTGYHGLKITYSQTSGSTTTALSGRTWGLVFYGTTGTSGGHHFGSRIHRTYSPFRTVLKDQANPGEPHTLSSSSSPTVSGQIVCSFDYNTSNKIYKETQSVHTGSAFAPTLSTPSGLSDRQIVEIAYGSDNLVSAYNRSQTGVGESVSYTTNGVRTLDLDDLPSGATLKATVVTDGVGGTRRYEYYPGNGRLYSLIFTPSDDATGRPRAHDSGNSGIGGVAGTDVEPTKITIYNIYDSSCVCQKPTEVREISHRGSTNYTRTTTYSYDSTSKLLTGRSVTNPATVGTMPLPPIVSWGYTYTRAKTGSQTWGAWLPDTEVTPDGTYTYTYSNWQNRSNAADHGQMPGTVARSINGVRIQNSLTGSGTTTAITETLHRNLSSDPGGYSYQGNVSGQPRAVIDGDGLTTTSNYSTEGWLSSVVERSAVTKRTYSRDAGGLVTSFTDNADSSTHSLTTSITSQDAFGTVYASSKTIGGVANSVENYYDRYGHLAVLRHNNLNSSGSGPSKHGASGSARSWVETQWIYQDNLLVEHFQDRKPLDEAAGTGQFLKAEYEYLANGRIDYTNNPNGGRTDYDLDGFGTVYRTVVSKGSATVSSAKRFINPFLEVTGSYEKSGSDNLWTLITRNSAGAITQIVEPSTTAPNNYLGSTGGAIHQFEIDQMGRVVEARAYTGTPSSGTLATRREIHYDQLNRMNWQHDVVLGYGSGDHYTAWEYGSAKETQLAKLLRTGIGDQTYEYWSSGLLKKVTDGPGNTVTHDYFSNTPFLSKVTRSDLDPGTSPRSTETSYVVNGLGRVTEIHEGPSSGTTLQHKYKYNSLGRVDQYEDPLSHVLKFLGDGLGRIVEHARVGGSSAAIINSVVFEDSGSTDGRTKVSRYDGLGNATIEHADFAGRPFIVQNPGGTTEPTSSEKHQSMCLYAEYDEASRVKSIYDGDDGRTDIWRDGPGRIIQRQLSVAGDLQSRWNTKDVLRRDAIGRVYQTDIFGSTNTSGAPNHQLPIVVEYFDQDSLGRVHEERYQFAFASANVLEVSSAFSGGNPYRSDLDYVDNLTGSSASLSAPIILDFVHDGNGRLNSIEWNVSGGSGQRPLAEYTWVGELRRKRTVHYGSSQYPEGITTYGYDAYNRLLQIQDEVWTSSSGNANESQFDYVYDAASNLLKEKYAKVDTSVGDRFAYDAYNRLTSASMGVDTTTMNASSYPTGWSSGAMHEYLTYGLDEANNRTTSTSASSSTTDTTDYTLQESGQAQGPSNRYDTVALPGASAEVTYGYDDRGNLRYDGRFYYQYDYLNRLQEVWKVMPTEGLAGENERFAVVEESSLKDSSREVKDSIPDVMSRLPREHKDPVFRGRLKARLQGGVIRLHPSQQGGGGLFQPHWLISDADLQLCAVYGYDAFNRRIWSVTLDGDSTETAFHTYDGWRQVVQYTLDDTSTPDQAAPTKQFVWGSRLDELLSYRSRVGSAGNYSWENYFILHGGQDLAAKLVNSSGAVVEQYEYDPHGGASVYDGSGSSIGSASAKGLPFLWKGIRLDNETGLLYMRNRYYSTSLGRFLTPDPIGEWGDPLNMGNGYGCVGERQQSIGDPFGLQGEAAAAAAAAEAAAMAAEAGLLGRAGAAAGSLVVPVLGEVVAAGLTLYTILEILSTTRPVPPPRPNIPPNHPKWDQWIPRNAPPRTLEPRGPASPPPSLPTPSPNPPAAPAPTPGPATPGPAGPLGRTIDIVPPVDPNERDRWICKFKCESDFADDEKECDGKPTAKERAICYARMNSKYTACIRNCNQKYPQIFSLTTIRCY